MKSCPMRDLKREPTLSARYYSAWSGKANPSVVPTRIWRTTLGGWYASACWPTISMNGSGTIMWPLGDRCLVETSETCLLRFGSALLQLRAGAVAVIFCRRRAMHVTATAPLRHHTRAMPQASKGFSLETSTRFDDPVLLCHFTRDSDAEDTQPLLPTSSLTSHHTPSLLPVG